MTPAIPGKLRAAYRLLKNAGYRRNYNCVRTCGSRTTIAATAESDRSRARARARLELLQLRLAPAVVNP